jgi:hypothetical protein
MMRREAVFKMMGTDSIQRWLVAKNFCTIYELITVPHPLPLSAGIAARRRTQVQ